MWTFGTLCCAQQLSYAKNLWKHCLTIYYTRKIMRVYIFSKDRQPRMLGRHTVAHTTPHRHDAWHDHRDVTSECTSPQRDIPTHLKQNIPALKLIIITANPCKRPMQALPDSVSG